jgi:phosphoserine aminotransferase
MNLNNTNIRNLRNFSGGPGALPENVLMQVQESIHTVPDAGLSILGISHRSQWFADVIAEAEHNVLSLLGLNDDYHVLFLQGGATQQFSTIAMSLMGTTPGLPEYLLTGYWSGKSVTDAKHVGAIKTLWSGESEQYARLPNDDELSFSPDAPYLHYISNETVEGIQFRRILGLESVPRICDMSSDFLSRPCEADRFSMIYAHAQKNLGPAGVTIVVIRKDLVARCKNDLPEFLDYRSHIKAGSIFNTPPVFAIYVVLLITRWLKNDIGGLVHMNAINEAKAALLYQAIDESASFYLGRSAKHDRSLMNVAFNLDTPALEKKFLEESSAAGFSGLNGHRAIGGLRASLYNGVTQKAVEDLVDFMHVFQKQNQQ